MTVFSLLHSLAIRTNIRNASAAPPNHRERRPARAENKVRLMNSTSRTTRESSSYFRSTYLRAKLREVQNSCSSRRRRLLAGRNSDYVAIERNGPVDRGRLISRDQAVRVDSCAHDAVVTPDVFRFAIQKVDRLHLTRVEDRYEEIAHRADVLDIEDEPVRRSLSNVHSVDGFASKVI